MDPILYLKIQTACLGRRPKCVDAGESLRFVPGPRILRLALAAVVVLAACYVSYGFGRLWKDWRSSRMSPLAENTSNASLESMVNVPPVSGQWSFGDLDWTFRSQIVDAATVDARLSET